MVELLSGGLGNIAVHGGVCCGLFRPIGLNNLAWDFLLSTQHGGRRAVLTVHNGKQTTLHRSNNHRPNFDQSKFSAI
jgi:hypothetical protein